MGILPGHSNRREEIVLYKLQIGHTHLTHFYQMNGEDVPRCVAYNWDFTVEHTVIECGDFVELDRHYDAENLQQ